MCHVDKIFSILVTAESKKVHYSVKILLNSLKNYSRHLDIESKPDANYQNPSSSGSQDIVLTRFSIALMAESKKERNSISISLNSLKR